MLTIQGVTAEQFAKLFHNYREALAHDCASSKRGEASSWDCTPQSERKLMVAATRLALLELSATPEPLQSWAQILCEAPAKPIGAAEPITVRRSGT